MLRQKIYWTIPSMPQVGGKRSVQKAKAGCFQHGCSQKRAVPRQQIPVDAADRKTASCPWTTELQPLTQQLDMCYHRGPPNVLWLRGGNMVMPYRCEAAVLFTLHTADTCRHQGLWGT